MNSNVMETSKNMYYKNLIVCYLLIEDRYIIDIFAVLYKGPEICFTDTTYRVNVCAGTVILCHIPSQTVNQEKLLTSSIGKNTGPSFSLIFHVLFLVICKFEREWHTDIKVKSAFCCAKSVSHNFCTN